MNMNTSPLYIATDVHAKLSLLLAALDPRQNSSAQKLRLELDRAVIVDPKAIAPTVVTMGSRVEIEDLSTGEVDEYTLVYPEHADVDARRLSVLAPIGTAVIGCSQGDEMNWITPGGPRRIKLRRVVPPAESAAPTGVTLPVALQGLS